MNMCAVNGQEYLGLEGLKTWGQLLLALENGAGTDRAVVTAVRFAGVDQPSFREPDLLGTVLETAVPIDVETIPSRELIAEAVETGLNDIAPLLEAAQQTADAFRCHDIADAQVRLGEVVTTLQALTQLTAAVIQADLLPEGANVKRQSSALLQRLGGDLEALVTAAGNEDWITVADVLEYDIAELLPEWVTVLRTLAPSSSESAPETPVAAGHLVS